ncbi:orotate phosphoribosyltransferase [Companilactobacillus sp.]|jgi:orotate phosphoribosyltransferase|uniref:orotate phosphoribosyltransferase n=1 Tax=Companilactobacillus sp. TaxID=2767905 RepID=UPI0025BCD481|nr:orotate phosphoribosyltransferase [Companilactobacillus sp.]MCH4008373.1 orotate phosphoribosyltransferase [Companilactobacillus sp.]MCH4051448.1 orotate phosphoribosyltransferase [Companilactobacillus sp.]MCH4076316.1 orotate phosphoribosyltransferase [Companilactobacillus sp.]MCH4124891.1 orotate phosphoribosyltransferase [Companilactobacillus sp.]MCH4131433.1 orotate phosphoribosyltransferase [Companilactobacillus sp.]
MENKQVAENIASQLLKIKAVKLSPKEPFTWISGIKSPIYTDNRMTIAYPEFRQQIAQDLADLIQKNYPDANVISGVSTAGIPHATGVANILGLPMNYVRSKPKDHGTKSQIEGRIQPGDKVVVIDDLISTAGSILEAVDVVRAEGAEVVGTAAIFTYNLPEADKNVEAHKTTLKTLTNYPVMIEQAQKLGYVEAEDMDLLHQWYKDPESWCK